MRTSASLCNIRVYEPATLRPFFLVMKLCCDYELKKCICELNSKFRISVMTQPQNDYYYLDDICCVCFGSAGHKSAATAQQ